MALIYNVSLMALIYKVFLMALTLMAMFIFWVQITECLIKLRFLWFIVSLLVYNLLLFSKPPPPCLLIILCWCSSLFPCWMCELLRLHGSLLWADVDEDLPTSPTTPAPCSLGSASPPQVGHLWEYSLFAYCTFKAINL